MRRWIAIAALLLPLGLSAQRIELTDDGRGNACLAVYAYGLPREIVKTNDEMRASVNSSGIMRRHHTTKGEEQPIGVEGYPSNSKISFGFIMALHNVDERGKPTQSTEGITWTKASGWDSSIDNVDAAYVSGTSGPGSGTSPVADEPTGCAAYKGVDGKGTAGEWRLPTQRELQVMFTVIDQAIGYIASGAVEATMVDGEYWTSTELCVPGASSPWHAWALNNVTGFTLHDARTSTVKRLTRCVKDIYEPINER